MALTLDGTAGITFNNSTTQAVAALPLTGGTITGNLVIGSGANGIAFPATQSASSDANTLDDYEEGTFTPTLTTSGTAPTGLGYAYRSASYTKIGNTVICRVGLKLNALTTTGSGEITITGFPFTSANYGAWQEPAITLKCYNFASTTTLSNGIASYFNSSSTQIYFRTGNSDTAVDASQMTSSMAIGATVIYQV